MQKDFTFIHPHRIATFTIVRFHPGSGQPGLHVPVTTSWALHNPAIQRHGIKASP